MRKFTYLLTGALVLCGLLALSVNAQESFQPLKRHGDEMVAQRIRPSVVYIPHIIVRPNYQPITIQDLSIKTNIIGNVAATTYEMVMFNPNSATLEAEFEFPLAEGQTIAAVALDINGKMREGVVVEKEKARQTFEAVVRQGADPLLVEKTAGNQFKTRIYPFSAQGTRRIRVVLEEPLKKVNGKYQYTLPLNFAQKLKHFSLDVTIPTEAKNLPHVSTDMSGFQFNQINQVIQSHFEANDYELNNTLSFDVPQADKNQVFTHQNGNKTYFYGDIDLQVSKQKKILPNKIAVVWDSSLSGSKRDITKEKELLTAYLKQVKNATVLFVPFDTEMGTVKTLSIQNGQTADLEKEIDSIVYDGATRFEKLKLAKLDVAEILLFTDGLNTFGKGEKLDLPNKPVYTINSSAEYSLGQLKGWANKTYGSFINLTNTDIDEALSHLTNQALRIVQYSGNNISDIYPVIGTEVFENMAFAGLLTGSTTDLEIKLGYGPNQIIQTQKVKVEAKGNNPAVERLWAMQKISYLEQNAERNKADILALGQKYSIVTEGTSLLVLENASDYYRYHITPPDELINEYNRLQANEERSVAEKKRSAWSTAKDQANRVKEWWNRKFTIPTPKPKFETLHGNEDDDSPIVIGRVEADGRVVMDGSSETGTLTADGRLLDPSGRDDGIRLENGVFTHNGQELPMRLNENKEIVVTGEQAREYRRFRSGEYDSGAVAYDQGGTYLGSTMDASSYDMGGVTLGDTMGEPMGEVIMARRRSVSNGSIIGSIHEDGYIVEANAKMAVNSAPTQPSIQIQQWNPDVPYLKILKESKDSELYADYLKLKKGYNDQPSFYFDITDEFIKRGQKEKAFKVLSNVIEMKLDNVELIRIAAHKLMQLEDYADSIELFEKVVELRGEDPQSYRDLALAYQAKGDYQKAFDTFYHIMETDWGRFNEIKQIIFVEMNNLLSLHPEVNTKDMDKDFVFNMPVDVRIALAWSTDNTDIDLHVVDPFNEECFYGHKNTKIGGRYPHDFTQGFGPEEFMLKRAANGKYIIRTNNFGDHRQSISGPTTLYLDLYTNYSRPNQTHERVLVRTENVKEKNSIGEITWEGTVIDEKEEALKPQYEGLSCNGQQDCGGENSGYFCNYAGNHTKNICQKTNIEAKMIQGRLYYYNTENDLKSWCREATESMADRAAVGNCNWGYLSYDSADSWCKSIGKRLVDASEIEQNCEEFTFLPTANNDQQYWTRDLKVVHMGNKCSIQNMVRGDGYAWAGGVICK